jgi:tRNA G18 (ribose-2'-O)-methylase SpoU
VPPTRRVTTRNAAFQQWEALLANRSKRHRLGEFLVHGVRPISLAVEHRWPLAAVLHRDDGARSDWARTMLAATTDAPHYALSAALLAELADRADADVPELLAVARTRPDDLARIDLAADRPLLVVDRPTSPGNLGTLVRSADAFGAAGVVVCGHGADPYDPRAVRASTGSLFAVPTVTVDAPAQVLDWLGGRRAVVGTDERGAVAVDRADLTGPLVLVVGNETSGLSTAWRAACTRLVRIPIGGAASSLNAAAAGTVALYEAARQRGFPAPLGQA